LIWSESVVDRVDAIAITSGVATSIEEEEAYVLDVVTALLPFSIPIGVSIYPGPETPARLHALGVVEVKFNLEAATQALFRKMCPGLSREAIWEALPPISAALRAGEGLLKRTRRPRRDR